MNAIEVYERCLSGKPYTKDLKIYSEKYLRRVVTELESLEEYEKCIELVKFIQQRFDHTVNFYQID